MLLRKLNRRHKHIGIALVLASSQLKQYLVVLIEHDAVLRPEQAEFVHAWTHLRRERKVRSRLAILDDHSDFISDLSFTDTLKDRTDETVGNNLRIVSGQELG